jgi:3-dehydroquinate dehydratase I
MPSPEICACITSLDDLGAALAVRESVSLYEVRIDLIGPDWTQVAEALTLPWIACNRLASQGGRWSAGESERLATLTRAVELGAGMVDIEVTAPTARAFVSGVKGSARVIVSHHDFERTASGDALERVVELERAVGADICKVVSTARSVDDCLTVIALVRRLKAEPILAFAMGPLGIASRVLSPLAGAQFAYASLRAGRESAPGQLDVRTLRGLYDAIGVV